MTADPLVKAVMRDVVPADPARADRRHGMRVHPRREQRRKPLADTSSCNRNPSFFFAVRPLWFSSAENFPGIIRIGPWRIGRVRPWRDFRLATPLGLALMPRMPPLGKQSLS